MASQATFIQGNRHLTAGLCNWKCGVFHIVLKQLPLSLSLWADHNYYAVNSRQSQRHTGRRLGMLNTGLLGRTTCDVKNTPQGISQVKDWAKDWFWSHFQMTFPFLGAVHFCQPCQMRANPIIERNIVPTYTFPPCPHPLSVFVSDSPSRYLKGLFCVMLNAPLHREFTGSNCGRPDILQQRAPKSMKWHSALMGTSKWHLRRYTADTDTCLRYPFWRSKGLETSPKVTAVTVGLLYGSVSFCMPKTRQTDSSFI